MIKAVAALIFCSILVYSCTTNRNYSPTRKFSQPELQEDYQLLRDILEKKHPSLNWYTSKDSMDWYFDKYYQGIKDSMTEQQFTWKVLVPLVDKIHCGHTTVRSSKAYSKWASGRRLPSFPLYMKIWDDTMAVTGNLNRKDSFLKRGTIITSVNGLKLPDMINTMFQYLPEDGYANNINYIRLSGNFPYYHRNIYGLSQQYKVGYIDSSGKEKMATVRLYPTIDSSRKDSTVKKVPKVKVKSGKKILQYRSFSIDSSGKFGLMTVNTFSKGRLRSFFRESFKKMRKEGVKDLIVDLRSNGGGNVSSSTLFTKYLTRTTFRVSDSTYSPSYSLAPYTRYIKGRFLNNIEMIFISHKGPDGNYHVRRLEKKVHKPKKKNHYNGEVYVLTNGPTFSAAALVCNALKGQPGITLAGEETGGGWYGNNGIIIPDINLPNTGVRVRLPLFRLVQYNHPTQKGTGIKPDLYIGTSYPALLKGIDWKLEVIKEKILSDKKLATLQP